MSVGFPQALPGHGAGRQLSVGLGTALAWVHTWHCRDAGLWCGGLPRAPPARPWPPSCAGRGEPGEGGAGRTVYVCRCQVLAGHRASRAGAQLLNPLRPPPVPPARDRVWPTLLAWSPCTPVTPLLPSAPHDQQWPGGSGDHGWSCSRGSWRAGGAAAQRSSPGTVCCHSPQHTAAPQLGDCGHPKWGSWVS